MPRGNKGKWLAAGLLAGAGASYAAVCHKLFLTTCARQAQWSYGGGSGRKKGKKDGESGEAVPLSRYGDRPEQAKAWLKAQPMEEIQIYSSVDDIPLYARMLRCDAPVRTVLCAHGYRGSAVSSFAGISQWLHENGCNVLLIDQRACGQSGGEYITFGAKEKDDVLDWIDYLTAHDPQKLPIYMYGVSLGASTVECASGCTLPPEVRGLIADCGYESMESICSLSLKKWYHIPPALIMPAFKKECEETAHFRVEDADARSALRRCNIPALFIHGTGDRFVPISHAIHNYQTCASTHKEIVWFEHAGHSVSYYENPVKYQQALQDFFRVCGEDSADNKTEEHSL